MTARAHAVALLALLALAGCASAQATAPTPIPNPVTLIRETGCNPGPDVTQGQVGIDGTFRVADCTWPIDNESIRVDTFRSRADRDAFIHRISANGPSDGSAWIVVDNPPAYIQLQAAVNPSQPGWYGMTVDPGTVAAAVGGTVQ